MRLSPLFAAVALAFGAVTTPHVAASSEVRGGEQVVRYQCSLCHAGGISGAPRIGDRKAWEERARRGVDALVRSAVRGRGAMPPSGGLADISEEELRAAIVYMLASSGAAVE